MGFIIHEKNVKYVFSKYKKYNFTAIRYSDTDKENI